MRSMKAGCRILTIAVGLTGCGGDAHGRLALDPNVPEEARHGGTIVVAGASEIESFSPAVVAEDLAYAFQRNVVLTTLLEADEALRPRPYLAESWSINDDSTQVEFRLRSDVFWHDGRPTTARDVAFTFEVLKDPEAAFPNAEWFTGWEGAEVIDERTIRFAVRPRAGLLAGWTRLPILPHHILGDVPLAELGTHGFGIEPVGNGPFRFVERRAGDTWVFEANPIFPDDLGGRPYADRLIYRAIPEPSTQLAELEAGEVHFVYRASPTQLGRARASDDLRVRIYPTRGYGFIAWNGRRAVFRDPAVRRAFGLAIDRDALVDGVLGGLGEPANGPIGPWHPAHDPGLEPQPFAPDSAASLLTAAGWVDADGDGIRERDGEALAFELLTTERDTYRDIAEIVQARLRAVGVDVAVRTVEGSALVDAIFSPERRFDAFVLEWEPDFEIDDRQLFSCAAVGEMFQFASYCNRELDPVLDSIPEARSRDDAIRLLRAYARKVAEDQPFTFLYFGQDAVVHRRELQGVVADIRGALVGAADWWLHPDGRTRVAGTSESG